MIFLWPWLRKTSDNIRRLIVQLPFCLMRRLTADTTISSNTMKFDNFQGSNYFMIYLRVVRYRLVFSPISYEWLSVLNNRLKILVFFLNILGIFQMSSFNPLMPDSKKDHTHTAQKMKFFIKGFFSKCDQIRRKLRIWSHLLKKSLMENFIFFAVTLKQTCR